MCVSVQTSTAAQHPALPSGVLGCRGKACIIFPHYVWENRENSVHLEFSQTLNCVHKPPQVRRCFRGDIFTSFSLHMWICRKCF